MRNYWFKMPTGAGTNPLITLTLNDLNAKAGERSKTDLLAVYALACEMQQENPQIDFSHEEPLDVLGLMTGLARWSIQDILAALHNRRLLPVDFGTAPKSPAERKRDERERKKNAPVTGHEKNVTGHEPNVTGHPREEKKDISDKTPLTPQGGDGGDFEIFWNARAGRGKALDNKRTAEREFHKLVEGGIDPKDLIRAMERYAAVQRDAKKDGTRHSKAASNFLADGDFAQYMHQETAPLVDTGLDLPAWQQPLCQLIKPHNVRCFFKDAELSGDGKAIVFPKKFNRDYVAQHFEASVSRCIGKVAFEVRT